MFLSLHPRPATFWVVDRAHTLLDYIRCFSHFTPGPPLSGWSIEPILYSIISDVSLTSPPSPPLSGWSIEPIHYSIISDVSLTPLPQPATFWVVDRAHTLLDYIRCFSHFIPGPPLSGWSIEPIHYSIISDVSLTSPQARHFLGGR